MAEGFLREKSNGRIDVFSAGTNPKGMNPLSIQVMDEIGVDISQQQSKDVRIFEDQPFDFVITVCNRARESCPIFPGSRMIHWDIPDPTDLDSFREVRDQLSARIETFLNDADPL